MIYRTECSTVLGTMTLTGDETALRSVRFSRWKNVPQEQEIPGENGILQQAGLWLGQYFSGEWSLPCFEIRPQGTEFQRAVWEILREIPAGTVCTYGEIARKLEQRQSKRASARAVGQAVGANPMAILIPCHRVIRSDGSLGGYAGGEARKRWLQRHEGVEI